MHQTPVVPASAAEVLGDAPSSSSGSEVVAAAAAAAADLSARSPGLSDDDITRVEARLGRALPELLISLYKRQNGGSSSGHPGAEQGGAETHQQEEEEVNMLNEVSVLYFCQSV